MKKYLALLAAVILVFTFVACGDDDDDNGSTTSSVASTASTGGGGTSSTGGGGFGDEAGPLVGVPAFDGWDCETESANSYGYTKSGLATEAAAHGDKGLYVLGTASANGYIYTSAANMNDPAGKTKLTFWMKGTVAGKSFSFNLGGNPAKDSGVYNGAWPFNLGTITGETTIEAAAYSTYAGQEDQRSNAYGGSVDLPTWTKITFDLTSCTNHPSAKQAKIEENPFVIKMGKDGVYDVFLDSFQYED